MNFRKIENLHLGENELSSNELVSIANYAYQFEHSAWFHMIHVAFNLGVLRGQAAGQNGADSYAEVSA